MRGAARARARPPAHPGHSRAACPCPRCSSREPAAPVDIADDALEHRAHRSAPTIALSSGRRLISCMPPAAMTASVLDQHQVARRAAAPHRTGDSRRSSGSRADRAAPRGRAEPRRGAAHRARPAAHRGAAAAAAKGARAPARRAAARRPRACSGRRARSGASPRSAMTSSKPMVCGTRCALLSVAQIAAHGSGAGRAATPGTHSRCGARSAGSAMPVAVSMSTVSSSRTLPRHRGDQTRNHVNQRGLARAGAAEERDDARRRRIKGDVQAEARRGAFRARRSASATQPAPHAARRAIRRAAARPVRARRR